MTLEDFSQETQDGFVRWAVFRHHDDLLFEAIGAEPREWAWIYFQLEIAEDRAEWFPKGKWATLQVFHEHLTELARLEFK